MPCNLDLKTAKLFSSIRKSGEGAQYGKKNGSLSEKVNLDDHEKWKSLFTTTITNVERDSSLWELRSFTKSPRVWSCAEDPHEMHDACKAIKVQSVAAMAKQIPYPSGIIPSARISKISYSHHPHPHPTKRSENVSTEFFFLMRCVPSSSIRTNQFNYATELPTNWLDCSTHWFALISKKTANASINAPSRQWYLG